jgi:hypothetical protein
MERIKMEEEMGIIGGDTAGADAADASVDLLDGDLSDEAKVEAQAAMEEVRKQQRLLIIHMTCIVIINICFAGFKAKTG